MKITESMIDLFKFPREIVELAIAPYLEMPTGEHAYVMQHHWRGRSVHTDWRMKIDGYLVGWTVLDNPKGTPRVETMEQAKSALRTVPFRFNSKHVNIGRRAETKARQPVGWLKIQGVTKPGEVGATRENVGVLNIIDRGLVIFGTQKPYFHEYFVKSSIGQVFPKNWTRIVVRRVGVPALDPETKKPLKKREVLWRVLVPGNQEPYAISRRAIKGGWKPPKTNLYPFPKEWTKKNFPKQFAKWEEWRSGTPEKKTCRDCLNFSSCTNPETLANPDREACENFKCSCLGSSRFTLHYNSWKGQFVVRGIPKREWYLRLDDGEDGVRTFFIEQDPISYSSVAAEDQGRVNRKWLDFEGDIPPNTKYNPNKKLKAKMKILDKGTVSIEKEKKDSKEVLVLTFKGKVMKGKWALIQEEKGAKTYVFQKGKVSLSSTSFVLQKHWIPKKGVKSPKFPADFVFHWDVRLSTGLEFNLYSDPLTSGSSKIKARKKKYSSESIAPWMRISKVHTFKLVGPLPTYVDPVDKGSVQVIEDTDAFRSFQFKGSKLKGYWIYKKAEGEQYFQRGKLPVTKDEESQELDLENKRLKNKLLRKWLEEED